MKHNEASQRQNKVAGLINSALIEVFSRGKGLDKKLVNFPLSITQVKVSADLKIAHCYFLPFNTTGQGANISGALNKSKHAIRNYFLPFSNIMKVSDITEALNRSKYAIRSLITNKINLKYSPEIRFYYDEGFDNANKVEQLLKLANASEK